jgi:putative hydrolase of the HAD superfamily
LVNRAIPEPPWVAPEEIIKVLRIYGRCKPDLRRGTDVQKLSTAYWAHRDLFDRGARADFYWHAVLEDAGVTHDADLALRLDQLDATSWTILRPDARCTLEDLERVGCSSCHPVECAAGDGVEGSGRGLGSSCRAWFFSRELNMAKLGIEPSAVVFFDDRQVSVEAARAAGWRAELWTSADTVQRPFVT